MKDEVEAGAWGDDVTVKWEHGHPVTLVVYGDDGKTEVMRENVEDWGIRKVRETLSERGFRKTDDDGGFGGGGGVRRANDVNAHAAFSKSGQADRTTVRTQPINAG